jgi:DNA-binding response OmpR family regulator
VVEDERRLAESLRAGLTAEGYAVDVVHNGRDALWLAGEHPYAAYKISPPARSTTEE